MRLTCPNCDAQYEVPDDVVPVEGRDVQCSSCGQTWFQHHRDHLPEEGVGPDEDNDPDEEHTPPEPEPEEDAPQDEASQDNELQDDEPLDDEPVDDKVQDDVSQVDDLQDEEEDSDDDDAEEPTPPPVDPLPRKEIDPAITDILRQEAEAETSARRQQQSDPLESQPDLGLPDTDGDEDSDRRTLEARQRMARMRGEPEPMSDADINAAAISSRRDLLPDIEEINSTLRTENDRASSADGQARIDGPTDKIRKRSFRRGFMMMLILFAILALIYVYAPQIARAVPQLDPFLSGYVTWVDGLRLTLDGWIQSGLRWLDTKATQSGS